MTSSIGLVEGNELRKRRGKVFTFRWYYYVPVNASDTHAINLWKEKAESKGTNLWSTVSRKEVMTFLHMVSISQAYVNMMTLADPRDMDTPCPAIRRNPPFSRSTP